MKHIFYILTLLPLLMEVKTFLSPIKTTAFVKSIKGKKWEEQTDKQKAFTAFQLFYIVWTIIGLFSFQWPLFLSMFCLGFFPKKHFILRLIDSLITIILLLFLIINAYHLKIDIQTPFIEIIKSFFNFG